MKISLNSNLNSLSQETIRNSKTPEPSYKIEFISRPFSSCAKKSNPIPNLDSNTISPSLRFDRKHMRFKKIFKNHFFNPIKTEETSQSSRDSSKAKKNSSKSFTKSNPHFRHSPSNEKIDKYFDELNQKLEKIEARVKEAKNLKLTYNEKFNQKLEKAKLARQQLDYKQSRINKEKVSQLSKSLIESSKRREKIIEQQQSKSHLMNSRFIKIIKKKADQLTEKIEQKAKTSRTPSIKKCSKKTTDKFVCTNCSKEKKDVIKIVKIQQIVQEPDKSEKIKSLKLEFQKRINQKIIEINEEFEF